MHTNTHHSSDAHPLSPEHLSHLRDLHIHHRGPGPASPRVEPPGSIDPGAGGSSRKLAYRASLVFAAAYIAAAIFVVAICLFPSPSHARHVAFPLPSLAGIICPMRPLRERLARVRVAEKDARRRQSATISPSPVDDARSSLVIHEACHRGNPVVVDLAERARARERRRTEAERQIRAASELMIAARAFITAIGESENQLVQFETPGSSPGVWAADKYSPPLVGFVPGVDQAGRALVLRTRVADGKVEHGYWRRTRGFFLLTAAERRAFVDAVEKHPVEAGRLWLVEQTRALFKERALLIKSIDDERLVQ